LQSSLMAIGGVASVFANDHRWQTAALAACWCRTDFLKLISSGDQSAPFPLLYPSRTGRGRSEMPVVLDRDPAGYMNFVTTAAECLGLHATFLGPPGFRIVTLIGSTRNVVLSASSSTHATLLQASAPRLCGMATGCSAAQSIRVFHTSNHQIFSAALTAVQRSAGRRRFVVVSLAPAHARRLLHQSPHSTSQDAEMAYIR